MTPWSAVAAFRWLAVYGIILLATLGLDGRAFASSITISPTGPTIYTGQTQQFVALSSTPLPLQPVRSMVSGLFHTCALMVNGTVECWGFNGVGQLGNGTWTNSSSPVAVSSLGAVVSITAGAYHTCALLPNGTVRCWGYNYAGQLGNGTTNYANVPVQVQKLAGPVVAITAGQMHTCAVILGGTVQCWGWNNYGQLGNSNPNNALLPVTVAGLTGATAVTAGYVHTCALVNGPPVAAYCWGQNTSGQLGNNTLTNSSLPVQAWIDVPQVIAAGGYSTCAIASGGYVMCWGSISSGLGPNPNSPYAPNYAPLGEAKALALGSAHACALMASGSVQCFGDNSYGELGNGTTTSSPSVAVTVSGLNRVYALSAGGFGTCAAMADGTSDCWGDNAYGELGNGNTTTSNTAVAVMGTNAIPVAGVRQVVNGGNHTCALLGDGTAECWGDNSSGQLGDGSNVDPYPPVPGKVVNLTGAVALAAGAAHTCALIADGTVECWGNNNGGVVPGCGQLPPPNINYACFQPTPVGTVQGAIAIAAGAYHTCALIYNGTVDCWGHNDAGQLCGSAAGCTNAAMPVAGVWYGVAITAGFNHTCVLELGGEAMCWGFNSAGQLGASGAPQSPVYVSSLRNATSIAAGNSFTCATLLNGSAECWGYNAFGELGNGGTSNSFVPVPVSNLSNVKSVAAGADAFSACAVMTNGLLECWGYNYDGQLGNGTTASSSIPVVVGGRLGGVVAATVGSSTASALVFNGSVEDWGYNGLGDLGTGNYTSSLVPVSTVPLGRELTWSSSAPSIASIDPVTGLATAGSTVGFTQITATYRGQTATTTLYVD